MTKKKIGETSYKETAFGIIPRSKLILFEIEGTKKAWDFILQERKRAQLPLVPDFFIKVHEVGFKWIFPSIGGHFRSADVEVSHHQPPVYYKVPQLMLDFCRDLEARTNHLPKLDDHNFIDELVDFLAWAHHRFLWIHPFLDYNGRIGRLLINMILLNLDMPPAELKVETLSGRHKYVRALQAADKGDLKFLKRLIREALEEAAVTIT